MDVSNSTAEGTDYRVTAEPPLPSPVSRRMRDETYSGTLEPESFTREIPLPTGASWLVEFFKPGTQTRLTTKTIRDPACLVILTKAENGVYKALAVKRTSDAAPAVRENKSDRAAQKYNEERLALLARKYGGGSFSAEDAARLEALTERVRRLLPRVTEKDWQHLEEMTSRLEKIRESTRSIRKQYRLNER